MKKGNVYYYLGVLLLIITSLSYYVVVNYWLFAIAFLGALFCIMQSDKKVWVKILTIIVIPFLAMILFFLLMFLSFGDEPI